MTTSLEHGVREVRAAEQPNAIESLESEVRSYCRNWPVVFDRARGARLWDADGGEYLDFFSGAGALNYGHNHPAIKGPLLRYLSEDRIVHSLDMATRAKEEFLQTFHDVVLGPRGLDYKVQFPGPTGTNAVEAALKLARKVTGREHVLSFTNAFHGMTLGALSVTGNSMKRNGAGVPLNHGTAMPYCGFLGTDVDSVDTLEALLLGSGSGLDEPAAVIVETVQGEGGINVASPRWLRRIADICASHGILLIVDDIQVGCGRTGTFFSFEEAGIVPDIVTLSKSLSGYGLPLAVTLMRRDIDVWAPGEHNGTFRGNNPAFVTATAALEFWRTDAFADDVRAKGEVVRTALEAMIGDLPEGAASLRGRGLIWGVAFERPELARATCEAAFERGLLVETSGPESEVVKLMPPLTASLEEEINPGLEILREAVGVAVRGEAAVRGEKRRSA